MSQTELSAFTSISGFTVGDQVVDTHDPDGVAVVLDPAVGRADTITVPGTETTVAEFPANDPYPADDVVVRVAFVEWLDAHAPGWRAQPSATLADWLNEYCSTWAVPQQVYDYPASRLANA